MQEILCNIIILKKASAGHESFLNFDTVLIVKCLIKYVLNLDSINIKEDEVKYHIFVSFWNLL